MPAELEVNPQDTARGERALWLSVLLSAVVEAERGDGRERHRKRQRARIEETRTILTRNREIPATRQAREWLESESEEIYSARWILGEVFNVHNPDSVLAQLKTEKGFAICNKLLRARSPIQDFTNWERKAA